MASTALGVRERLVAAASKRIGRVKRIDRVARAAIAAGGIFIIASVIFIFLFIASETLPLFEPPTAAKLDALSLPPLALATGVDEYQKYVYQVLPEAKLVFYRLEDGSLHRELPIPGLENARATSAFRSLQGDFVAVGADDGRVSLMQVRFRPVFEGQALKDLDIELRHRGSVTVDAASRAVRDVSYWEAPEGDKWLAALVGDSDLVLVRFGDDGLPLLKALPARQGERFTVARLGRDAELVAATASGWLYLWDIGGGEARLVETVKVSDVEVSALEYALGGATVLVGDRNGALGAWFRARPDPEASLELVKAHEFEPQGAPIVAIQSSTRERSFATGGADGSVFLRHLTSERTLLHFPGGGEALQFVLIAPRADGILVCRRGGTLERYSLSNPHPDFSWRAVWGKVWYEGYSEPEYVWQSTGGTDDFEPKLSLVPLVFGTIKATLYALIFAVPLSVAAALYTSQFVHPPIRAKVKPTVEIMAALPSVVIGFVAGLWLASRVEAAVVPFLLLSLLLPLFGTAGVLFWERLPGALLKRLRPGLELLLILPLLLAGGALAIGIGPGVESLAFGGDFKGWLSSALGLVYDQRNSLVVGMAMGFAVIPIIFTISEDAFSSVPQHLTAASLALGASRWQTATRVVLPTASPGIFSATMVGFGRAVGETMIVLMATGNTPLLDWSPFNGMRTLSANIAVEIPEAPHGATLYRVLFLSAAVLFLLTFAVNTAAELVRQRLREKYRAI
jgi:phosphate transport system permease protein